MLPRMWFSPVKRYWVFVTNGVGSGLSAWGSYAIGSAGASTLAAVCGTIFVVAWIFQFIGHEIEGKKPSFLQDLQFLMIGPAWLLHFVYKKTGVPY